ncbi:MAG: PilZ domain-containing protein [Sedimenticola sp.]
MLESSDKRDFHRMTVNCSARFRIVGDDKVAEARIKDLSGSGMLLLSNLPVDAGALLHVAVLPEKEITPPLYAVVEVTRCDLLEGEEGVFALACNMVDMPDVESLGESFP